MELLLWVVFVVLVWIILALIWPARMERLPRRVKGS